MWDLAKRSLENAIAEKLAFDDEKKDLLYELASIHEQTGNSDQAFEIYKSIFEMDIGYRDVDSKVTAYYEAQSQLMESSANEN
jgi:lipoprotein NlpI